jgi:hypothetical protein
MGLLNGKLDTGSVLDRLTLKGLFYICGGTFLGSAIALPVIGFGTFTARDSGGWLLGLLMLIAALLIVSVLLIPVLLLVAWIQRGDS